MSDYDTEAYAIDKHLLRQSGDRSQSGARLDFTQ